MSCCGTQSGRKEVMLDGRWDVLVLPNQAPPGDGVVRELRGACGALPAATCRRSWQLGLQLDLEWTWKALANASRAAAGPPHWSLKPAGRPTAQHPDCQIPMMRSTSHEIGSSGKGVRDQFEQKSHRLGIILRTRHSHQVSKTALDGPSASRACSSSPPPGSGAEAARVG